MLTRRLPLVALAFALSSCGGGGGDGGSGGGTATTTTPIVVAPAPSATDPVATPTPSQTVSPTDTPPVVAAPTGGLPAIFRFAQTHVLLPDGTSWTLGTDTTNFHLVGNRGALALVQIGALDAASPVIEGFDGTGSSLGTVALTAPGSLASEPGAGVFSTVDWTAQLPASWIVPGLKVSVRASNYPASGQVAVNVGADSSMTLRILPFYLFGATPANTYPLSRTQMPSESVRRELLAKWPLASLAVATHGAGYVSWDRLVVPPKMVNNVAEPAYLVTSMDQQHENYGVMSAALAILGRLRAANGEGNTDAQYYSPLLAIDTGTGRYHDPYGGLGFVGGGASVGDYRFAGVFIHEVGHGFGLPHQGDAYVADPRAYPYIGGSLKGSAWGYDGGLGQFLSAMVPTTALNYSTCRSNHQPNESGAGCYKQDPMQGGAGDQGTGYNFGTFSDFSTARMQLWMEGLTTMSGQTPVFNGGRIFVGADGSYTHWNTITKKRMAMPADATTDFGAFGINAGLPTQRDVPVYAIVVSLSRAGTANASYIYPPVRFTGNLIRQFDPRVQGDLDAIKIGGSAPYRWYCQAYGCDYTLRVTYDDGSVIYRVLQSAFRTWFQADQALPASATDPMNEASFRTWAINVPADRTITKVELLDTPMVWNGMPTTPAVVLSR